MVRNRVLFTPAVVHYRDHLQTDFQLYWASCRQGLDDLKSHALNYYCRLPFRQNLNLYLR